MSTTDDAAAVGCNNSTMNLLRLFEAQPNHQVITKQDLTRVYDKSHPVPSSSDGTTTAINHYYTWNSSSTNASIHKEKAAFLSTLHAVKSSSSPGSPCSFPSPSKSFTRSHRVQDIVSMCSEERCGFSADDHEATAAAVGNDDDADNTRWTVGRLPDARPDLPAAVTTTLRPWSLFDRVAGYWSCDDRDDDGTTSAAANGRRQLRRQPAPSRPATKKPGLSMRPTRFK